MRKSLHRSRVLRTTATLSAGVLLTAAWLVLGNGPAPQEVGDLVKSHAAELYEDTATPVAGNPRGDVPIVEFFDYNCVHCRRMAPVLREVVADDPGIRLLYKELPFLSQGSAFAALGALAAARQDKYAVVHQRLMALKDEATKEAVLQVAETAGLDRRQLHADMQDPALVAALSRNRALAEAFGIEGTPVLLVGTKMLVGRTSVESLRQLIEEQRNSKQANM